MARGEKKAPEERKRTQKREEEQGKEKVARGKKKESSKGIKREVMAVEKRARGEKRS